MEPIKIMAWDKEKNEWYKPTFEAYKNNLEYLCFSLFSNNLLLMDMDGGKHESLFPDRFDLYLSTTAHDREGKEIYAGHGCCCL